MCVFWKMFLKALCCGDITLGHGGGTIHGVDFCCNCRPKHTMTNNHDMSLIVQVPSPDSVIRRSDYSIL